MHIDVNGHPTYGYTGGKALVAAQPTVVFIHGVLNDHSVWALQSRYLAHHGWNVLAIDLPGHGRSAGAAPATVEEGADFVLALLDAVGAQPGGMGAQRAALVGHSWGSLIALEAAARLRERISRLALVGTAFPMKVAPALMAAALDDPHQALRMVNLLSRSTLAAPPSALGPGTWVLVASMALGRKLLRNHPAVNLFHRGLLACDSYANGAAAIAQLRCPVLFALGAQDRMTPPQAAQGLIRAAQAAGQRVQIAHLPVGHHQMTEAPEETLCALRDFLAG
ncbi:alpha/beta fold hydrolase [Verminephrobacter eiseniae]|uniref:alpha/beta fold hydrolase n=1 Tax=Verminephrobacter eiseniae TaxID=364317 RepID=UPI0022388C5B|nr:alpha/beta hydrolase [Verminephrobacter eiseniae]MCW5237648.1 alpha/beta hydrolase [Verminephrobacter eiseniae]